MGALFYTRWPAPAPRESIPGRSAVQGFPVYKKKSQGKPGSSGQQEEQLVPPRQINDRFHRGLVKYRQ
jgi:hypothetical protein